MKEPKLISLKFAFEVEVRMRLIKSIMVYFSIRSTKSNCYFLAAVTKHVHSTFLIASVYSLVMTMIK